MGIYQRLCGEVLYNTHCAFDHAQDICSNKKILDLQWCNKNIDKWLQIYKTMGSKHSIQPGPTFRAVWLNRLSGIARFQHANG